MKSSNIFSNQHISKEMLDKIAFYQTAINKEPENVKHYYHLAECYSEVSEYTKAVYVYTDIINNFEDPYVACIKQAEVFFKFGKYGLAIADLNKVFQFNPSDKAKKICHDKIAEFVTLADCSNPVNLQGLDAKTLFAAIVRLPFEQQSALLNLCIHSKGSLKTLIDNSKNALNIRIEMCIQLKKLDNNFIPPKEIENHSAWLKWCKEYFNAEFDFKYGCLYLNQNKPQHAIKYFDEAFKKDKTLAFSIGCALVESKQTKMAMTFFDSAVNDNNQLASKIANFLLDQKEYIQASVFFDFALTKVSSTIDCVDLLIKRGLAYHGAGKYQAAVDDFMKVIRLNTGYKMDIFNHLANTYEAMGDLTSALACHDKIVKTKGLTNSLCFVNRAQFHVRHENYKTAILDYTRAINMVDAKNIFEHIQRAKCHIMINNFGDAIADYKYIVSCDPGKEIKEKYQQMIIDVLMDTTPDVNYEGISKSALLECIKELPEKYQHSLISRIIYDPKSALGKRMRHDSYTDKALRLLGYDFMDGIFDYYKKNLDPEAICPVELQKEPLKWKDENGNVKEVHIEDCRITDNGGMFKL